MLRRFCCAIAAIVITALTLFVLEILFFPEVPTLVNNAAVPVQDTGAPATYGVQDLFNSLANTR